MRRLLQVISWLALAGVIVPPALYLAGSTSLETVKSVMLAATLFWFIVTPLWMGRRHAGQGD